MGTNYYHVLDCCDKCGRGGEKIHIGKSSGGWPFSVHIIPEDGLNNWQDWVSRLENGASIIDEYDRKISLTELDELVKFKRRHKHDPHVLQAYKMYPQFYKKCETGDKLVSGEFS
jgi:hypothetical protein